MFAINNIYKGLKTKNPKLYLFLKRNKALQKFTINYYRDRGKHYNRCYEIMESFTWNYTPEGDIFWNNLHNKYYAFKRKLESTNEY